jgi:5-methylcytosine-specific restriction endonuclease McrA
MDSHPLPRNCLRDPIPEIFDAARFLDAAVSAHLLGKHEIAEELIRMADMPVVAAWTASLCGAGGPWSRPFPVEKPLPFLPKEQRFENRMPNGAEKAALIERDGFNCRFCGLPLIRKETRSAIRKTYPLSVRWGNKVSDLHAAFHALWLQYDHLIPHSRGGTNDLSNMLVTCAPCNYGRWHLTLEEVGLADPRVRAPVHSGWDGLERFHQGKPR